MSYLKETKESVFNKPLLLKLYKTSQKAEIQPAFRAKLAQKKGHYSELEVFKIQLENEQHDPYARLYSEAKQQILYYRLTFLAFALLFAVLTTLVFNLSHSWNYTFLFDSGVKTKWIVGAFSAVMAFSAFCCAIIPSTLQEATRHVVGKTQRTLHHLYEKQYIQNGLNLLSFWGEKGRKRIALRHIYQEILEKAKERGEDTYRLLKKISKTPALTSNAKERLYNQALADLQDKLHFKVHSFKHLEIESSCFN